MRRLLPNPLLSVLLLTVWLLLIQSVDASSLLLGALLTIFWPLATAELRPVRTRIRHPAKVLRLLFQVVQAMLHSSLEVAWAILSKRPRALRSAFVRIPLELTDPGGLAALAAIVTFTPGTAWAQLSADHRGPRGHSSRRITGSWCSMRWRSPARRRWWRRSTATSGP